MKKRRTKISKSMIIKLGMKLFERQQRLWSKNLSTQAIAPSRGARASSNPDWVRERTERNIAGLEFVRAVDEGRAPILSHSSIALRYGIFSHSPVHDQIQRLRYDRYVMYRPYEGDHGHAVTLRSYWSKNDDWDLFGKYITRDNARGIAYTEAYRRLLHSRKSNRLFPNPQVVDRIEAAILEKFTDFEEEFGPILGFHYALDVSGSCDNDTTTLVFEDEHDAVMARLSA